MTTGESALFIANPTYAIIWTKAVIYYFNGADWFRKKDLLNYPKKSWPRTKLKNIAGQIANGFGGLSPENPILINSMWDLFQAMELFHFEIYFFEVVNGGNVVRADMSGILDLENVSIYFCLPSRETKS